jgi:hypothetical protein
MDRLSLLKRVRSVWLGLPVLLALGAERAQAVQSAFARVVFFEEDFEGGDLGNFTERICPNEPFLPHPATAGPCGVSGPTFWHAEGSCNACSTPPVPLWTSAGSFAAAYNRMDESPPVCTYDTPGQGNAGSIETGAVHWPTWPPVPMQIAMTFDLAAVVQPFSIGLDRLYLEVDTGQSPGPCGNDWSVVAQIFTAGACGGGGVPLLVTIGNHPLLDSMASSSRPFRFRFDTVDATENSTRGVYLDNVRLLNAFCAPCVAIDTFMTLCAPRIESAGGEPRVGNLAYSLNLVEAPSSATAAVLVLGLSHTSWNGTPLPWNIPGTQGIFGACTLCVSADVLLLAPVSGTGICGRTATQPLGIPPAGGLAGAQVFAQWAVMDPLQTGGIRTSDAAAVVVQP